MIIIDQMVQRAVPLLQQSHLLDENEVVDQSDVQMVRNLVQTVAPVDAKNAAVHTHLHTVAKVARHIGQDLKS